MLRTAHRPVRERWEPRFDSVHQVERRSEGWGMHNGDLHHGRTVVANTREEGLLDVAVTEEGGVRVFCGRGIDRLLADSTRYVIEQLVSGLVWQTLALAADIAAEAHFLGNWHVGVAMTNARGVRSYWTKQHQGFDTGPFYELDDYRQVEIVTFAELQEARSEAVERLVGRLNRALNDGRAAMPEFAA